MIKLQNNINLYNNFEKRLAFNKNTPLKTFEKKSDNNWKFSEVIILALATPAYFLLDNGIEEFNKRNIPKFALALGALTLPLIYLGQLVDKKILNKKENKKNITAKIIYNTVLDAVLFPGLIKLMEVTKLIDMPEKMKKYTGKSRFEKFIRERPFLIASIMGAGVGLTSALYTEYRRNKKKDKTSEKVKVFLDNFF